MARKGIIQREKKRQLLVIEYNRKRIHLKDDIRKSITLERKFRKHSQLQRLPRNSAPIRLRNRCLITGRPRGFFRYFGLSRHYLRELAHECFLPGVVKSSW